MILVARVQALAIVVCLFGCGRIDFDPLGAEDASLADAVADGSADSGLLEPPGDPGLQVSAGVGHSCARLPNGEARCWGRNGSGQIGDGTNTRRAVPTAVLGLSDIVWIFAATESDEDEPAGGFTCAVRRTGAVSCWGDNRWGTLGDAFNSMRATPMDVPGVRDAVYLAAGVDHVCALSQGGEVSCWGRNQAGQIGVSMVAFRLLPTVIDLPAPVARVAAGFQHTCALINDGRVFCWGGDVAAELGRGVVGGGSHIPRLASVLPLATDVVASDRFTCVIGPTREVHCVGSGLFRRLGRESEEDSVTPVTVAGLTDVASISSGHNHVCAVTSPGRAYCWGDNGFGELGAGRVGMDSGTPLLLPIDTVQNVSAGVHSSCAASDGSDYCWGAKASNQLGDGTGVDRSTPTLITL